MTTQSHPGRPKPVLPVIASQSEVLRSRVQYPGFLAVRQRGSCLGSAVLSRGKDCLRHNAGL